jgi:uncharacterized protein involved in exopolysaccharide biosynthesis
MRSVEQEARHVPKSADAGLLQIASVLLRNRWIIAGSAIVLAAVVVTAGLMNERTYTASTVFMAHFEGGSAVSGIAAQFGLRLADKPGQTPAFYADLLRSRSILAAAVQSQYSPTDSEERSELLDILDVSGPNDVVRLEKGVMALSKMLNVRTNWDTGVVTLSVTTQHPWLSEQLVSRLLELVNDFDLTRRRSQAAAEREFVASALEERSAQLRAAENALERFFTENRHFSGSPALSLQQERLQREVLLRHGVVMSLAQAFEQARIDEIRNTPVITVVEPPVASPLPDRRGLLMKGVLAILLGASMGLFITFIREYFRRTAVEQPEQLQEFVRIRNDVVAEMTLPLRLVRLHRRADGIGRAGS